MKNTILISLTMSAFKNVIDLALTLAFEQQI